MDFVSYPARAEGLVDMVIVLPKTLRRIVNCFDRSLCSKRFEVKNLYPDQSQDLSIIKNDCPKLRRNLFPNFEYGIFFQTIPK